MKVWGSSAFASFVVVATLVGYPTVAAFSVLTGVQNTSMSILLRAGVLSCTLIIISLRLRHMPKPTPFVWMLVLLMALYGLRLAFETAFDADILGKDPSLYWIWYIGVVVQPCLSVLFFREFDYAQIERWVIICLIFSALVVLSFGSSSTTSDSGNINQTGRFALESLNSISVGYIGAQLALLGIWRAFVARNVLFYKRIFDLLLAVLGMFVLFLSSSRGPVLATLLVLLFMFMSQRGLKQVWLIFAVVIFVAIGTSYLLSIADTLNVSFLSRMMGSTEAYGSNTARASIYQGALKIVYDNPYFGGAIEVPTERIYPHNFFLEFYMATGIIAGTTAVVVMVSLVAKSLRIMLRFHSGSIIAQFYVMNLIGAQFSGAVYSSAALWMCAMIVAVVPLASLRRQRPAQEPLDPINRQLHSSRAQTETKRQI